MQAQHNNFVFICFIFYQANQCINWCSKMHHAPEFFLEGNAHLILL